MKITFLGATQTVTGSKYLIEEEETKVLIDCGLFQGYKELRLRNWDGLPFAPASLNALLLTHAHIDHTGYIPLLVKKGFKGKIYCSEATYDLCSILLPDSGHLQEEDAERANRYGYTKHTPALPLYTEKEAKESLHYFHPVEFGKPYSLKEDLHFILNRSGHILGSSFITLSNNSKKSIVFSGDLGRLNDPIMTSPTKLHEATYIVIESTYGDRLHEKTDPSKKLGEVIRSTIEKGGSVVIPSFAVGRAQSILYYLHQLKTQNAIPNIPIFLDSPMAVDTTRLLCKYKNDHRLSSSLCKEVSHIANYVTTVEFSKQLDQSSMPSIIISASGMATGGRVLHHLKHFITDPKNTILFTGFQAGGTRGDRIIKGEKFIKIHGEMFPVRAHIEILHNLSAHADYEEILIWLGNFRRPPKKVFITHGEIGSAESLKSKIEERFGWDVYIPSYLYSEEL